ncbi:hypothetical protein ACLOJK_009987 [Asimina triloba]
MAEDELIRMEDVELRDQPTGVAEGEDVKTEKHDEIVTDFGELLTCVEALRISQHMETTRMKQKHQTLEGTLLRIQMELTIVKRNQGKLSKLWPLLVHDFDCLEAVDDHVNFR